MSKLAFFRQSGWMVIATGVSGALFALVHTLAKRPEIGMSADDYTLFGALLSILAQMTIPAVGLQLTMVKLAVEAEESGGRNALAGATRSLLAGTFAFWAVCALAVFIFQESILTNYRISNPWTLWATVLLGLASLWSPIFFGVLQGRQNFLWLGLVSIFNSGARVGFLALAVLLWGATVTHGIVAALIGMAVALAFGGWQVRDAFIGKAEPFKWIPWLKRVIPMTLGYGAATFMLTEDPIIVRRYFLESSQTEPYIMAGTLARVVFFFLAPLTTVMFPKIARSAASSEKTSVLMQALGVTALMGVGTALCLTIIPQVPMFLLYGQSQSPALELIPIYAWCLLPLPLANVLVNNLLARERYGVVPWLAALAAAYYFALSHVAKTSAEQSPQRFDTILYTLGGFGILLLGVCLIYAWQDIRRGKPAITPVNA